MKQAFYWLPLCIGVAVDAFAYESIDAHSEAVVLAPVTQHALARKVSQAIQAFEQTPRKEWAYKISRYENEEGDETSSIEQYESANPAGQRWSLLRINGKEPSQKQQETFLKDKQDAARKNKAKSFSVKLGNLIQLDTLKLTEQSAERFKASFAVVLDKLGEDASEKLTGELTFNQSQAFIEKIQITNIATFSPMFSAKITDFALVLDFTRIEDAILPIQHTLNMKGSFAFFTEIDEVSTDTYSDYIHHPTTQQEAIP